ncbi:MAG: hypothetical protein ACYDEI_00115 [Erysipelotrichaceae bacterium]
MARIKSEEQNISNNPLDQYGEQYKQDINTLNNNSWKYSAAAKQNPGEDYVYDPTKNPITYPSLNAFIQSSNYNLPSNLKEQTTKSEFDSWAKNTNWINEWYNLKWNEMIKIAHGRPNDPEINPNHLSTTYALNNDGTGSYSSELEGAMRGWVNNKMYTRKNNKLADLELIKSDGRNKWDTYKASNPDLTAQKTTADRFKNEEESLRTNADAIKLQRERYINALNTDTKRSQAFNKANAYLGALKQ